MSHRPATMPTPIRLNPAASLKQALWTTEAVMDKALWDLEDASQEQFDRALLDLQFSELYHQEREVLLLGEFFLSMDRVDMAVALLGAWSRNPWRTA